ncbi:MAG: B12-binding domain-containing radical SAM protein [bacterium]
MMLKVLLVKSSTELSKHIGTPPPLGIMYIASYLRDKTNHSVKIFDARLYKESISQLYKLILMYQPDIIGISALTVEADHLHTVSYIAKSVDNNIKVVVGGPYITSSPSAINDKNIDVGVIGEGEITFKELLDAYEHGISLHNIRGIVFRSSNNIITTPSRTYIENLDDLPYPAWDLIELNAYFKRRGMSTVGIRRYMTLFTSRGCPFHCTYCHNIMGKRFRARSIENVLEEIRILMEKYNINDFEIIDDISNFDRERFKQLMRAIIDKKWEITISFPNGVRTDMLDEEIIYLMKKAGVSELSVAIETASPRLQKMVRKNLHLEKIRYMIDVAAKNGIFVRGFFMLGFPTETEEELRSTINFACKSKLHEAIFFKVNPFGGTELYEQALISGKITSNSNTNSFNYHSTSFNLSEVPTKKFNRLYMLAYVRFYSNINRIIRILQTKKLWNDLPLLVIRVFSISIASIFKKHNQIETVDINIIKLQENEKLHNIIPYNKVKKFL